MFYGHNPLKAEAGETQVEASLINLERHGLKIK